MALLLGDKAPDFKGTALVSGNASELTPANAFQEISLEDYKGKWLVFFFYPLDFTFVCPTELKEFGKHYDKFKELNCEILTASTDSQFSHLAWRNQDPGLKELPYPMLSDFTGEIAKSYEVLKEATGYALRGLYIIDPEGNIQYSVIHPEQAGRNVNEVLRVLQALQIGGNTPCGWEPGDDTL